MQSIRRNYERCNYTLIPHLEGFFLDLLLHPCDELIDTLDGLSLGLEVADGKSSTGHLLLSDHENIVRMLGLSISYLLA